MDNSATPKRARDSIRVMLIEPGQFFHSILENYLGQLSCQVITPKTPGDALTEFDQNQVDLVLTGL